MGFLLTEVPQLVLLLRKGSVFRRPLVTVVWYSVVNINPLCRYYRSLIQNLSNKYKEVHAAAAEVLGMILSYISEKVHIDSGPLHNAIVDHLQRLLSNKDEDKFTTSLHKIALVYPSLVDRYVIPPLPGRQVCYPTPPW